VRAKTLCEEFEWDKEDALRIWAFGPENSGPNILTNKTMGVQYMTEIKDSMSAAWQWATA